MKRRIVISGASGTGKSTLAKWIGEYFNIPYISTSTKPLWPKYGIESHQQLIDKTHNDKEWGIQFQIDLLDYRAELVKDLDEWVSDRGPVDNIVYFLTQCTIHASNDVCNEYIHKALTWVKENQTKQIMLAYGPDIPLENDGMRINNWYYQWMTDAVFERVITAYLSQTKTPTLVIPFWDMEKRKESCMKFLSNLHIPSNNGKSSLHSI